MPIYTLNKYMRTYLLIFPIDIYAYICYYINIRNGKHPIRRKTK
nr:MAG TPA: hypothetical protein [Caudoviricetes sp.]